MTSQITTTVTGKPAGSAPREHGIESHECPGETHGADRTRDLDHVRDASFAALGSKDSAEKFARRVIHHRPSKSVPLIFPRERRMRYPIGTREQELTVHSGAERRRTKSSLEKCRGKIRK